MLFKTTRTFHTIALLSSIMVISVGYRITDKTTMTETSDQEIAPSIKKTIISSKSQTQKTVMKPVKQKTPKLTKVKQKTNPPSQERFFEYDEIIQVNYIDDEIIDESWEEMVDEEAYIEQKRLAYEAMTDEELAIKQRVNTLEEQLISEQNTFTPQNNELSHQLAAVLDSENEQSLNSLIDLTCTTTLCRIALNLPDETAQYEAMDSIASQIENFQQQAVDVVVKPDDSRIVTLYLAALETGE